MHLNRTTDGQLEAVSHLFILLIKSPQKVMICTKYKENQQPQQQQLRDENNEKKGCGTMICNSLPAQTGTE